MKPEEIIKELEKILNSNYLIYEWIPKSVIKELIEKIKG